MSLVSLGYYLFLFVSLMVYYLAPHKYQWCILLVSSLVFYYLVGTPWTFIYVLISVLVTWFVGKKIKREKLDSGSNSKKYLLIGLLTNLAILFIIKYTNFFLSNISAISNLFTGNSTDLSVKFISSLGLSFYTLQIVGYLLDVYWGTIEPEENIFKLGLFTCFFPQMVSGPISRYSSLNEELFKKHEFKLENIEKGSLRITVGIFKKLVIASNFSIVADYLLDNPSEYFGLFAFGGMIAYVIDIYTDFAGCMDIVIGTAKCFDIELVENFNKPFSSTTVQEFWQRWHVTLGLWLRDYIMYPLLRSKAWLKLSKWLKKRFDKHIARKVPTHLAMFVVWFCMGLWHGGGWNYILEGIWFWLIIDLSDWLFPVFEKITHNYKDKKWWRLFRQIRTLILYAIGAIIFRSAGLIDATKTLVNIFSPGRIINSIRVLIPTISTWLLDKVTYHDFLIALIYGCICFVVFLFVNYVQNSDTKIKDFIYRQPLAFKTLLIVVMLYFVVVFGMYGPGCNATEFIYGGF